MVLDLYPPDKSKHQMLYTNKNILYVQTDLDHDHLPMGDRSADLCMASRVSLYLDDPLQLVNNMIRAAKPGGYIIIDGLMTNLCLDEKSRGQYGHLSLFYHVDTGGALNFFFNPYDDDYLVIKVNDPSYQISGFQLNPHQLTKQEKYRSATQGIGGSIIYRKK